MSLTLTQLAAFSNPSWVQELEPDPEQDKHVPNKTMREVYSGHYVLVKPTPLKDPLLVTYSKEMAKELGLSPDACRSEQFLRFFSGDVDAVPEFQYSWATPYALSIYGQPMYHNCPFGTGNGYGDGRAISVAEVLLSSGHRYELQLKGGGKTPFCRTADGRAVLRSSVREFLVSEYMHHCGISTTRALSLVASRTERVMRPWYSNKNKEPTIPNIEKVPTEFRQVIMDQYMDAYREPDVMKPEICAITCRVARSFLRVGHFELFSRRVSGHGPSSPTRGTPEFETARRQLELLVKHAISREYPELRSSNFESDDTLYLSFLQSASSRIAHMTAEWIRVGYCQGNFNSDNCLVAGRTMDYGPFGFIEKFKPLWNMWSSGGEHFGFLNQGVAGSKNFETLVHAVLPLISSEQARAEAELLPKKHDEASNRAMNAVWRDKLGLDLWSEEANVHLLRPLLNLMKAHPTDYTMVWRQLAEVVLLSKESEKDLLAPLRICFWEDLTPELEQQWKQWVETWLSHLKSPLEDVVGNMKAVSPKYVPREFMLVEAYTKAEDGDFSVIHELQELFRRPYAEQPDMEAKYYKKAPQDIYKGIGVGGVSHMSCSS